MDCGGCGGVKSDIEHWELSQGTRVVFRRLPSAKVAAIYAAVQGGIWTETKKTNGISTLLVSTMDRGTKKRSDDQISEEAALSQADLDGVAGRNFIGLRTEMVGRNFDAALDLFLDVLFQPRFGKEEVAQEVGVLARDLETQEDYFDVVAGNLFLEYLYPSHPYGMNVLGSRASLSKITSAQLRKHYQTLFRPDRFVISVVGDLDPDHLRKQLEAKIPKPPKKKPEVLFPPPLLPLDQLHEVRRPIHGEKAYVQYGFRGCCLDSPDRFALEILASLLSSSGGGRLYVRIREELGLAYSIDTVIGQGLREGFIAVQFNTTPDRVDQALEEVNNEWKQIREKEVPSEELERVKNYLVGSYQVDLQRSGPQAAQLCLGELYGTERTLDDYLVGLSKVTPKDVQETAQKYLTPDRGVLVILSPMVN